MSISFAVGGQRVRFAGQTDVGQVRALNEDNILVPEDIALGVVSDGMGGHACGEVASQITVETIEAFYHQTTENEPPTWPMRLPQADIERERMVAAIKLANAKIFETAANDADKKGMGCTVDAAYVSKGRIFIGHVGDSRVYRLRGGVLSQLTEDHSLLNDYKRMKDMTADDIANFRHKNVVVRALGLSEAVAVDVFVEETVPGDLYLLCSDGLTDMLDDAEVTEILNAGNRKRLDGIAGKLVDEANEAGGKDNISAVLIAIEDG